MAFHCYSMFFNIVHVICEPFKPLVVWIKAHGLIKKIGC